MHTETTRELDMSAHARTLRRHAAQRAELKQVEARALAKIAAEGWRVSFDRAGNWVATQGSAQ